jgi:hypothetical protein
MDCSSDWSRFLWKNDEGMAIQSGGDSRRDQQASIMEQAQYSKRQPK